MLRKSGKLNSNLNQNLLKGDNDNDYDNELNDNLVLSVLEKIGNIDSLLDEHGNYPEIEGLRDVSDAGELRRL